MFLNQDFSQTFNRRNIPVFVHPKQHTTAVQYMARFREDPVPSRYIQKEKQADQDEKDLCAFCLSSSFP